MRRKAWLAASLCVLPAFAEELSGQPDPEFLEFLAETAGEDEAFADYVESRNFERELRKAGEEWAVPEGNDDER